MSVILKIEDVWKQYRLGVINHGLLYKDIQSYIARKLGRPDPHLPEDMQYTSTQGDRFWALKDINLDIEQGDRIGIIGRNGAGKSTLLKILSRVTTPTRGQVKIKGRIASLLEVGTGFHPELTGRENVYLNGAIMGMNKREVAKKLDEIVSFAGVEKFIDTPVKRYSSGMRVRLAFSVAAHLDPDILIVDEVLAVGDAEFQKKALGKMEDVSKEEGRTILFVSHNMSAINRLCKDCIVLKEGIIILQDQVEEAINTYLSMYLSYETIFVKKNDPNKPITLRKVFLEKENNLIQYSSPININIEYQVNKKITNCTVWMALETMNGGMVFTTADYDTNPEVLGQREIGYYSACVNIPGSWLNSGEYVVIVGIVENNPLVVHERTETIRFKVDEVGSPGYLIRSGGRRGVLQPFINWEYSIVDETTR